MSVNQFLLEIVTPKGVVYSREVEHVRIPGSDGYFGVLVNHTPVMAALAIGEIQVTVDHDLKRFATSGGYAEVLASRVILLAETAEEADKIDVVRARNAEKRAEERIREHAAGLDDERARAALARALNRLRIAEH